MKWVCFFLAGAFCSWPMHHVILRLPIAILESAPPAEIAHRPQMRLVLTNGLLWTGCAWHWPVVETAICWSFFTSGLLALSIIDWQTTLLPDALTQPLLWGGLLSSAMQLISLSLEHAVWGAAFGYGCLWLVAKVFTTITHKEGMGAGDFKLLGALGAWLGPWALLPLVFFASLVGAVVGLLMQSRDQLHHGAYVPFGPFLAAAGMVLALTGHAFFLDLLMP